MNFLCKKNTVYYTSKPILFIELYYYNIVLYIIIIQFKEVSAEDVDPYADVDLAPTTTEAPIANCMRYDEDGYTFYMVSILP